MSPSRPCRWLAASALAFSTAARAEPPAPRAEQSSAAAPAQPARSALELGQLEQQLGTWFISPGVAAKLWRFRPRLGLGVGIVRQSNSFRGDDNSSSQVPLLAQLVLSFEAVRAPLWRLDTEARIVVEQGANLHFMSIGVNAGFDIVSFDPSLAPAARLE